MNVYYTEATGDLAAAVTAWPCVDSMRANTNHAAYGLMRAADMGWALELRAIAAKVSISMTTTRIVAVDLSPDAYTGVHTQFRTSCAKMSANAVHVMPGAMSLSG